jgi:hypothetical protein
MRHLKCAADFIESQIFEVPPIALLPFPTDTSPPVSAPGFATYAFPLFVKSLVPAAICYSGLEADCALLYAAPHPPPGVLADRAYISAATVHGSLLFLKEEAIDRLQLIRVNERPFADSTEEIAVVSNLLMMGVRVPRPATSMIPGLLEKFATDWRVAGHEARPAVFEIIADIQAALITRRLLREKYIPAGVLDVETMEAISSAVKFKGGRPFVDRKVHAVICDLPRRR